MANNGSNDDNIGEEDLPLKTITEAKAELDKLPHTPTDESFSLTFQGTYQSFKVHRISIWTPRYNLKNTRTQTAQKEYLAMRENVDKSVFNESSNLQGQSFQHRILRGMDTQEKVLEQNLKAQGQTEPIILDSNGVVWNGNRRLVKMRDLNRFDAKLKGQFEFIKVVVLPNVPDEVLIKMEAELDIQKTGKADFTWHAQALRLRKMIEDGIALESVAEMRGMKKKDIALDIKMINMADKYLQSRNKVDIYSAVAESKFGFNAIVTGLDKNKIVPNSPQEKFALSTCFNLMESSTKGKSGSRIRFRVLKDFFSEFAANWAKANETKNDDSPVKTMNVDEVTFIAKKEKEKRNEKINQERLRNSLISVNTSIGESLNFLRSGDTHDLAGVDDIVGNIEKTLQEIKARLKK